MCEPLGLPSLPSAWNGARRLEHQTIMTAFTPPFCPRETCRGIEGLRFQRKGQFWRKCDNRWVPRFRCLRCRGTFSLQTFRVDYGLHKPLSTLDILRGFVAKTTQRHMARTLGIDRKTIAHRLELLGRHCERFHRLRLPLLGHGAGRWSFVFDELESFEQSRIHQPLTVPVLVHEHSYFVVDLEVGQLPSRNKRRARAEGREARPSESKLACSTVFRRFNAITRGRPEAVVATDKKTGYGRWLSNSCRGVSSHTITSSKRRRDMSNPLAPINLTFAMMRDGLSRLVRRNWAYTKKRGKLRLHLWIWSAWRNYVRQITNKHRHRSPASTVGIEARRLGLAELVRWRVFDGQRSLQEPTGSRARAPSLHAAPAA
jgi:transposase-like protein